MSGSWRLNGARVTVISTYDQHKEETSANGSMYNSVTYNFEVEDMLLGEGSDLTMAELRPCLVTEQFGADSVSVIDRSSAETVLRAEKEITNENSMKEFAYSRGLHRDIIAHTRENHWYKEEMFTRFNIIAGGATPKAKTPDCFDLIPSLGQL